MNDKSHLLRFGYAPGNYWFVCRDCGSKHAVGDKRSTRCEACAESLHAQITSVEAVADKHRAMTTLPEEAVKAAMIAQENSFIDGFDPDIQMKAALTAAVLHLATVRVNVDEIVQPLEDIHAPGGLCRWTDVATAIGEVRRALSALEPSAARELALEERLQAIEQQLVVNLEYFHDEKRILLETLQSHIISHISAIRTLSSPDHADAGKVEGDGCCTNDEDELTECFRHHIRTSIGWQAFGARTGKERQMYEEGFKAGYRRCKSDNEPELGEEEELSQRARKIVGRLRESIKAGAVNLSDVEDAVDLILDQDAVAIHPVAERLPQDVISLVIAAREFWEDHYSDLPSSHALDEALEAFSSRVLYENEPDALPSTPASEGAA